MKTCKACGESKPLDGGFYRDKKAKDGRRSRCKKCVLAQQAEHRAHPDVKAHRAEYRAEHYRRNRDAVLAHRAEYYQANPHISWEHTYRQRARSYGFEPRVESFTRDELIARWGDACYLCGGEWDQLEHVTPVSRGGEHSLDNCRPVCEPCNRRAWAEYRRAETA